MSTVGLTPDVRREVSELVRAELERRAIAKRESARKANEESARVRGVRTSLRDRLQAGDLGARDFLFAGRIAGIGHGVDPDVVGKITLHQMLTSFTGIGDTRAARIIADAGAELEARLDSRTRLEALTDRQRLILLEVIARQM